MSDGSDRAPGDAGDFDVVDADVGGKMTGFAKFVWIEEGVVCL